MHAHSTPLLHLLSTLQQINAASSHTRSLGLDPVQCKRRSMAGELQPGKTPVAELPQPEQTRSTDMARARLAGKQPMQPDQLPSADMACAGPSRELARHEQMPSVDVLCARLSEELLPVPDQPMPSAREVSARLAAAKEMSFAAEDRVRGLLKELSTVEHPLEPSSAAAEHRTGLLRALEEAQEESRIRALEVELAYMEAKRTEAHLTLEEKKLVMREAMEMGAQMQQALASMASMFGGVLNVPAFSEQNTPSLGVGEAGKMKAQLEQVLGMFMTSFRDGSKPSSSSRDSASTTRAHSDDAGGSAQQ